MAIEKGQGGPASQSNDAAARFQPRAPEPPPPPKAKQPVPSVNYKPLLLAGIGVFVLGIVGGIIAYQFLLSRKTESAAEAPDAGGDDRMRTQALSVSTGGTPYQVEAATSAVQVPDRMMFAPSSSGTFSGTSFTVGSIDTIQKNAQNMEPQLQRILQKYGDRPIIKEIMADIMKNPAMKQVQARLGPNATPAAVMAAMPDPQAMMPVAQKYMARPEFISVMQEIVSDPEVVSLISQAAPGAGEFFRKGGPLDTGMRQVAAEKTAKGVAKAPAKAGKRAKQPVAEEKSVPQATSAD